ncbi:uncharacterized protein LOC106638677 [Copidosoma floridanum]|uniref:uncharacterized protein LOC106638677 n=1 Tax=Copidosoma floridanum TaxID=29053 RepID=UPI0006C93D8E|nr:uncharacterized protein LOC106638677 [Copidosoma floridanum]
MIPAQQQRKILHLRDVVFKAFGAINRQRMATSSTIDIYKKIETFVFFDLETTGLIRGNRMPRIIELAMVAAARNSIRADQRNKRALPRILHKLSIPICPEQPITSSASYTTDIWNDALENFKPFDESTYNMVMQFIQRLPAPVCFVAHNGKRFDYPVFLAELERINKSIPDEILCVDSLTAFKEFYSELQSDTPQPTLENIPMGRDEVDEELAALEIKKSRMLISDDNWNDALYSVLDGFEKETSSNRKMTSVSEFGKDVLDSISYKPKDTVRDYVAPKVQLSPKSMQVVNETTPVNQIIKDSAVKATINPRNILNSVRKQLNFGESKPINYKLCTIYEHIIGCEPQNQHCAEADCISVLSCVCQIGHHFAEWADCNAVSLNLFKRKAVPCTN